MPGTLRDAQRKGGVRGNVLAGPCQPQVPPGRRARNFPGATLARPLLTTKGNIGVHCEEGERCVYPVKEMGEVGVWGAGVGGP